MSPMNHHLPRRVLILWMALTGCASQPFELRPDEQEGFFVRLPDSAEPDAIVVRVPNGDTSPLHIDWRTSAIRLPNGFDSPVVVDSAEPVSTIPPGQSAEYRIRPVHHYTAPDRPGSRRSSLESTLISGSLFDDYATDFQLTVLLPMCQASASRCGVGHDVKADAKESPASWRVRRFVGTVIRG